MLLFGLIERREAQAELGTVRTAPRGRAPFTFTSFGDQATPTLGKLVGTTYLNDNLGSPAAGDLTAAVDGTAGTISEQICR